MAKNRTQVQSVSAPAVAPAPETVETTVRTYPSIRQLIMAGITAGKTTKEIGVELQAQFPNSQAAAKFQKHVAWYRGRMKKDAKAAAAVAVAADAE